MSTISLFRTNARSTTSTGNEHNKDNPTVASSSLRVRAYSGMLFSFQVAVLMLGGDSPFCIKIALRCRSEFGLKRARDLGNRALDLVR
jgi:hypothetical protein